jgi:hypothetical protein
MMGGKFLKYYPSGHTKANEKYHVRVSAQPALWSMQYWPHALVVGVHSAVIVLQDCVLSFLIGGFIDADGFEVAGLLNA